MIEQQPRHHSLLGDAALLAVQVGIARKLARRYVHWGLDAEAAAMRAASSVLLIAATGTGLLVFALLVLPMTLVVATDPWHGGWWLLPVKLAWLAWSWLTFGGWIAGAYHYVYSPPGTGPWWLRILATPRTFLVLFLVALPSHVLFLVAYNWVAHTWGTL